MGGRVPPSLAQPEPGAEASPRGEGLLGERISGMEWYLGEALGMGDFVRIIQQVEDLKLREKLVYACQSWRRKVALSSGNLEVICRYCRRRHLKDLRDVVAVPVGVNEDIVPKLGALRPSTQGGRVTFLKKVKEAQGAPGGADPDLRTIASPLADVSRVLSEDGRGATGALKDAALESKMEPSIHGESPFGRRPSTGMSLSPNMQGDIRVGGRRGGAGGGPRLRGGSTGMGWSRSAGTLPPMLGTVRGEA